MNNESVNQSKPQGTRILGRRHIPLMVLIGLVMPAFAGNGGGYLAVVGPPRLRFFSLPPVAPAAPVNTTTNSGSNVAPVQAPPANTLEVPNPLSSVPAVQPVQPQTGVTNEMESLPEAPQPGDVISPQMLLKYFNKSTNGTGAGIIAPFDLSVPRSTPQPSSKATYSN